MNSRRRPALLLLCVLVILFASVAAATASAGASTKRLPGFRSPTGNIRCFYVPASRDDTGHLLPSQLLCSIGEAEYAKRLQSRCLNPPGAAGSGVDWHGWRLGGSGKGSISCSGGILYDPSAGQPSYALLAYGKTWRQGVFTCASKRSGVTCRNGPTHGLFLSSASWRAW